eukprot:1145836-Pelagomonas_calceolata.AAC.4
MPRRVASSGEESVQQVRSGCDQICLSSCLTVASPGVQNCVMARGEASKEMHQRALTWPFWGNLSQETLLSLPGPAFPTTLHAVLFSDYEGTTPNRKPFRVIGGLAGSGRARTSGG